MFLVHKYKPASVITGRRQRTVYKKRLAAYLDLPSQSAEANVYLVPGVT